MTEGSDFIITDVEFSGGINSERVEARARLRVHSGSERTARLYMQKLDQLPQKPFCTPQLVEPLIILLDRGVDIDQALSRLASYCALSEMEGDVEKLLQLCRTGDE